MFRFSTSASFFRDCDSGSDQFDVLLVFVEYSKQSGVLFECHQAQTTVECAVPHADGDGPKGFRG